MTIYRIKNRTTPFVQMEKAAAEDRRLSWKAKGILIYLLSKPDDFVFYIDELVIHSTDGIDSLRSGIKELQKFGYVKRYPIKEKGKIISWGLDVFESPYTENPQVGKPQMENPTLIINKDLNYKDYKDNKTYITLTSDAHRFIEIYLKHFKQVMNKDHPRVLDRNYSFILNQIEHLTDYDITDDEWEKWVEYHLDNLSEKNNGSILPFLKASHRYFEVGVYDQFD